MTQRPIVIPIDPAEARPLFLQIARTIRDRILAGQLKPGDRLPGSRRLADSLAVHRNTVLAAFQELIAEGWLEPHQGDGTYVSQTLPPTISQPLTPGPANGTGFDFPPIARPSRPEIETGSLLDLSRGIPDTRLLPAQLVASAFRRVFQQSGNEVVAYGDPQGHFQLRDALSRHLCDTRGLLIGPDELLVTRGSQQALDLIFRLLVRPGDRVAVEELGYPKAHAALRYAGIQLCPVALDEKGMRLDSLEDLIKRNTIKAIYVTPHHQYPTMVTLSVDRRLKLIELARQHRIPIIEDDYDHEFHYSGPPILPMASLDRDGVVIYVGTLSKILAPGLRIGYVAAPRALIDCLTTLRRHLDISGEPMVQLAAANLITQGDVQRYANKVRRIYQARRDCLAQAVMDELGPHTTCRLPSGGLGLWIQTDPAIDVDQWEQAALQEGVVCLAGRRFAVDGQYRPALRMVFAAHGENELKEAARRLARALPV